MKKGAKNKIKFNKNEGLFLGHHPLVEKSPPATEIYTIYTYLLTYILGISPEKNWKKKWRYFQNSVCYQKFYLIVNFLSAKGLTKKCNFGRGAAYWFNLVYQLVTTTIYRSITSHTTIGLFMYFWTLIVKVQNLSNSSFWIFDPE